MGKVTRKRKLRNKEEAQVLPKRVKGRGLAYLLALEKGGSKRHLATAQAKVNASEAEEELRMPNIEPKVSRKMKQNTSLLLEPFKYGWRREVVYRATVDPGTKTLCDVYYYSPDGKKLRSGREVAMHLEKVNSHLGIDNFAFFKDPIGIDSNQELVRHAKKRSMKKDEVDVASNKKPLPPRTSGRKKTATHKKDVIKANEEELIRNLQELGGIIAKTLENAKCLALPSTAGKRRPHRQATSDVMMRTLQAQTFQTRALLSQTFQSRSQKYRTS